MKYYFAPMQGVAGHIYRSTYHKHFGAFVDRYYAPFIFADQCKGLKKRDLEDIHPDNNLGMTVIPQLLTNSGPDFIHTAKKLRNLGYHEVNLNLGCPASTVVAKKRGSGLLPFRDELKKMLDYIFEHRVGEVSIKTRLGKSSGEEFYDLIELYNEYPLAELIIHPRVQTDLYDFTPNFEVFKDALSLSKNPVCYNGDLFTPEKFRDFSTAFPEVDKVMLGRGLLMNMGLLGSINGMGPMGLNEMQAFHDELYERYRQDLVDERRVLFRMKELWFYMIGSFLKAEVFMDRIKRVEDFETYEQEIAKLFLQGELAFEQL